MAIMSMRTLSLVLILCLTASALTSELPASISSLVSSCGTAQLLKSLFGFKSQYLHMWRTTHSS